MRVRTASAEYDVVLGRGILGDLGERCAALPGAGKALVVTDDGVPDAYVRTAVESLEGSGLFAGLVEVPAGEASKSWDRAGELLDALARAGLCRTDVVVALGGGVVGDLAGFSAAVFMRGVRCAQVPTTLLAQVDSSIGGKTGVDLTAGKNLAGAFWQPSFVLSDLDLLSTLPEAEWISGLAEVAKSAVLAGPDAVDLLERDAQALGTREPGAVERAVRMAAELKVRVVSSDERETGARESLNLGHTLGHAIEKVAGYGVVAHGVAVGEGMRFAALLGEDLRNSDPEWTARQGRILASLDLPATARESEPEALLAAMRSDKKVREGELRFVLTSAPGEWKVIPVDDGAVLRSLERWTREKGSGGAQGTGS